MLSAEQGLGRAVGREYACWIVAFSMYCVDACTGTVLCSSFLLWNIVGKIFVIVELHEGEFLAEPEIRWCGTCTMFSLVAPSLEQPSSYLRHVVQVSHNESRSLARDGND